MLVNGESNRESDSVLAVSKNDRLSAKYPEYFIPFRPEVYSNKSDVIIISLGSKSHSPFTPLSALASI